VDVWWALLYNTQYQTLELSFKLIDEKLKNTKLCGLNHFLNRNMLCNRMNLWPVMTDIAEPAISKKECDLT
jgi:hypothetical protein